MSDTVALDSVQNVDRVITARRRDRSPVCASRCAGAAGPIQQAPAVSGAISRKATYTFAPFGHK